MWIWEFRNLGVFVVYFVDLLFSQMLGCLQRLFPHLFPAHLPVFVNFSNSLLGRRERLLQRRSLYYWFNGTEICLSVRHPTPLHLLTYSIIELRTHHFLHHSGAQASIVCSQFRLFLLLNFLQCPYIFKIAYILNLIKIWPFIFLLFPPGHLKLNLWPRCIVTFLDSIEPCLWCSESKGHSTGQFYFFFFRLRQHISV